MGRPGSHFLATVSPRWPLSLFVVRHYLLINVISYEVLHSAPIFKAEGWTELSVYENWLILRDPEGIPERRKLMTVHFYFQV